MRQGDHTTAGGRAWLRRLVPFASGLIAILLLGVATHISAKEGFTGQGLVPVRDFQPIQGLSLQMPGDSALPLAKGAYAVGLHAAESATILQEFTPTLNGVLKLNQLRTTLDVRYGLTSSTEIRLEIATLYNHSGGLDGLISAVEHLFDKVAPVRESLKRSGFAYLVTRNGQTLLEGKNGAHGLADTVLGSKTLLVAETNSIPAIALRTAIKLPTGDKSRTFGTGLVDLGLGLAVQKNLSRRLVLYQNVNAMFPLGHYLGFSLKPYLTSITGVEFMATAKCSITGQFDYHQTPFHDTGLKLLDNAVTEGVLAFGYRFTPRLLWQLYGVENLDFTLHSAPDFTLATMITYRFNPL